MLIDFSLGKSFPVLGPLIKVCMSFGNLVRVAQKEKGRKILGKGLGKRTKASRKLDFGF